MGLDMWDAHWTAINNDAMTFKKARHSKGYNDARRISLPAVADAKKWPMYEVGWDGNCITRIRLDFIPADLGPEGLEDLHCVLVALMHNGWAFVIEHGIVTRLDVAVDFPNVEMDDLLFLPQQGVTSQRWCRSGKLESYQLGKAKGNCTMIYNRRAKRVAQGKPWAGKTGIRVERRLRSPGISVSSLPELAFPFTGLCPIQKLVGKPAIEKKAYFWEFFIRSAESIGLAAALALLPTNKRTGYRKFIQQNCATWWKPEEIWPRWQSTLSDLKVSDTKHWC
jgi:hypothetical protein